MSTLYLIVFLGLAFADVFGEYNCENGVFSTLNHVTEQCRVASYMPHLNEIRKTRKSVSGNDVLQMLDKYCKAVNAVTNCTEEWVDHLACLKRQKESSRTMNRLSNWFCDGSKVRGVIEETYSGLPMEYLNDETNECYRMAAARQNSCIKQYLDVSDPAKDKQEIMRLTLQSLPCLFKELRSKCSRDTSLLLVTLQYDYLIIPPALGINVSDILLTVANLE